MGLFFALQIFSNCIFVPYSKTSTPKFKNYTDIEFQDVISQNPVVLALVIGPHPHPLSEQAQYLFSNSLNIFSKRALFTLLISSDVPQLVSTFQYENPFLVLFQSGRIYNSCECPTSEDAFMFLLNNWLIENRGPVKTLNDLRATLSSTLYTLISKEKYVNDANSNLYLALPEIGSCELITAKPELFDELNMSNEMFLLFRSQDLTIVPVQNSTSSILEKSIPLYKEFTKYDIMQENITFAAIFSRGFEKSYHENLYQLSNLFPKIRFGVVPYHLYPTVQHIFPNDITFPNFYVFNPDNGYFYPHDKLFDNVEFRSDEFLVKAKEYINDIMTDKIARQYFSEEIPEIIENESVQKIVGLTYKDFIENESYDAVVLYSPEFGPKEVFQMFIETADEVAKSGNDKIKFGILDPIRNASPLGFPVFVQRPHIEIFPRGSKNNSMPMLSLMNRNGFLRFLNDCSTSKIDLDIPELTKEEALKETDELAPKYELLPENIKQKIQKYVETKLEKLTNLNPFAVIL
ncbi:Thioredoxin family protein [Histomonas meleagridis]|uniref:Thioredoxin family protein n=1 Tax=Histomonas meleagridis TaxID=135588 RepID=UPI003559A3AB|nr:Thioredoxin family protein [Histomonas meleagridis]KAH0799774.1 Thioredoxin family protein [Histomonas meleagridis]